MRPIMNPYHPYLRVFGFNFVMLGVNLNSILGRRNGDRKQANCCGRQQIWEPHMLLPFTAYRVGWELTPYPLAESNLGSAKIVSDRYSVPLLTWEVSFPLGD